MGRFTGIRRNPPIVPAEIFGRGPHPVGHGRPASASTLEPAAASAVTEAPIPPTGARVLVFGAGSLGSLLGGLLARAHDVTLVGREPHVQRVREAGLRVEGDLAFRVDPAAATAIPAAEFDLALVTVKAGDTDAAAEALAAAEREDGGGIGAVWSLQNGLGNEERLAAAIAAPVLAGTCTCGARLVEPGVVECTGAGEVAVGSLEDDESAVAGAVGAAAQAAGVEVTVADRKSVV